MQVHEYVPRYNMACVYAREKRSAIVFFGHLSPFFQILRVCLRTGPDESVALMDRALGSAKEAVQRLDEV